MIDPENRKDFRRKKLEDNNRKKYDLSEEQRFANKNKKQIKRRMEDVRSEEILDDWEEET
jgi:hypothetical protein